MIDGLPLPLDDLRAMISALGAELPRVGCDNTLRLASSWLASRGIDAAPVLAWLKRHGAYCDCEVMLNVMPEADRLAAG
jgi:hypothetical protein